MGMETTKSLTSVQDTVPKQCDWVTLNKIRIEYGLYGEILYKWNIKDNQACDCGAPSQSIYHIITDCSIRGFKGTINNIHNVTEVVWIKELD